ARRRTGAQDEILPDLAHIPEILDPELPVGDRGDLVQEDVPGPLGVGVDPLRPNHDAAARPVVALQIEREVEYSPLAGCDEALHEAFERGGLAHLPWATEGVDGAGLERDRLGDGRRPVETGAGERLQVRVVAESVGPPPPRVLLPDLLVDA